MMRRKRYNPKPKIYRFELNQIMFDFGMNLFKNSKDAMQAGIKLIETDDGNISPIYSIVEEVKEKDMAFPTISIEQETEEVVLVHNDQLNFGFHGMSNKKIKSIKSLNLKDIGQSVEVESSSSKYTSSKVANTSLFDE